MANLQQLQMLFDITEPEEKIKPIEEKLLKADTLNVEKIEIELPIINEQINEATKVDVTFKKRIKNVEIINIPSGEELFSKMYYTMGEVTQMFGVNHSLIRFWENEFEILKPKKSKKGNRLFKPEDVKNLELIFHLLKKKKFTIEGAKEYLKTQKKLQQNFKAIQQLESLKNFLLEIKSNLQ